jgi:hypothetical protein
MDALRYAVAGVDRIAEVHGIPPRPQAPAPAAVPDPATDYGVPVPQERYRRLPSGRMAPEDECDRRAQGEAERRRRQSHDHLWHHGWE